MGVSVDLWTTLLMGPANLDFRPRLDARIGFLAVPLGMVSSGDAKVGGSISSSTIAHERLKCVNFHVMGRSWAPMQ